MKNFAKTVSFFLASSVLLALVLFFFTTTSNAQTFNFNCRVENGFEVCDNDPNAGNAGTVNQSQGVGTIDSGKLGVPTDINEIIGNIVQIAYAAAGIIFFFMFLLGGLRYILAGGDEKAATAARSTLTQAVIGLVIVVAAFLITQLLFTLFGIKGFIQLG